MNILQIFSKTFGSSGSRQTIQLSKELQKRGHNVTLIVPPDSSWENTIQKNGVNVIYYNLKGIKPIFKIRSILKKSQIDIVHVHRGRACNYAWLASLGLSNCSIVASVSKNIGSRFKFLHSIKKVMTESERKKNDLCNLGVPEEKIEVIYFGTNLEKFNPNISGAEIRKEFDIQENSPLIGMVGHFKEAKGHQYFVSAADIILKQIPEARFILVGSGKIHLKKIEKMVSSLNLEDKIILTGYRDDVPECMAAMDIYVDSSIDGVGLSGTLCEAIAMRKPVVLTSLPGNNEIITDEETGIFVPPKSSEAIAAAVLKLIRDKELSDKLAAKGRNLAEKKFSEESRVNQIEKLYQSLVNGKI